MNHELSKGNRKYRELEMGVFLLSYPFGVSLKVKGNQLQGNRASIQLLKNVEGETSPNLENQLQKLLRLSRTWYLKLRTKR